MWFEVGFFGIYIDNSLIGNYTMACLLPTVANGIIYKVSGTKLFVYSFCLDTGRLRLMHMYMQGIHVIHVMHGQCNKQTLKHLNVRRVLRTRHGGSRKFKI